MEPEQTQPADNESVVLSCIGYLPMMFFVPMFLGRHSNLARTHGRQSLVAFAAFVAAWIAIWASDLVFGRIIGSVVLIGFLFKAVSWVMHNVAGGAVSLGYVGVMVVGIVFAAQGRAWRVPLIGQYADRLPF